MAVTPHLLLIDFQDDYCPVLGGAAHARFWSTAFGKELCDVGGQN